MTDPRIEQVLAKSELPARSLSDLRAAIDSAPYLKAVMLTAIDNRRVARFALSENPHEGGHYERRNASISISPDVFRIESRKARLDALVGVVAHEAGHALMAQSADETAYRYAFEINELVRDATRNGDAHIDVTPFAQHLVSDYRSNEGLAELISMNSVASRVSKSGQAFDLKDFLARADPGTECIDDGKLDAGIQLNGSGLQSTGGRIASQAVERVAMCHFDNGAKTLGLKGTSSYDDYYAAYALGAAVDAWEDHGRGTTQAMPLIEVDLAALKTSQQGVENAGIDLGAKGSTFDFIDTSHGQRQMVSIRQLGDGAKQQPDTGSMLADNPAHPDHASYQRIQQWVSATGQWDSEQSSNVSAALYRQQAADPLLARVDKVTGALGRNGEEHVFAVYAPFGDKGPFFCAQVDGRDASQQPALQSLEQAEQVRQQQTLQQQQEQRLQQDQPIIKGPAIAM